jgi:hypothetical protein
MAATLRATAGEPEPDLAHLSDEEQLISLLKAAPDGLTSRQLYAFLSDRYRRLARRRGKKRAIVAVGNSVLTIIWHVLSEPDTRYHDLGPSYHDARINRQRRQRDLTRQLEHLTGKIVILHPKPALSGTD